MRAPWAVVCDFDGTALALDLGDEVAFRFAGEDVYRAAAARYHEGEFPFSGLLERVFAPIRASREEIAAFARERAIWRPGFESFLGACRAAGRPFLVVSAGLDVYIEPVLDGLPPALRAHVEVRANVGFGLRFVTPIGPAALDLGFNVQPDSRINEATFAPHFTIGLF